MNTTWKVTYCNTPYNYNTPGVLIIDAPTQEDACITALDHLTRNGLDAGLSADLPYDFRRAVEARLDNPIGSGHTLIRDVQEYTIKPVGTVLAKEGV